MKKVVGTRAKASTRHYWRCYCPTSTATKENRGGRGKS